MKRLRWVALATAVGVVVALTAGTASGQSSANEAPKATEVGVSANQIRIAVIADVNTPLAPGLFKGSADAVQAFGKYINKKGGIAKRQVQVDFIDSKLSPDETRNAIIQACQNDFAIVGTTALFLNNVDDMIACKDLKGQATGLPDIPELTTDVSQQRSPVSFPIIAPTRDWAHPTPEVYNERVGQVYWFKKNVTKDLHGVFLIPGDLKSTQITTISGWKAMQKIGVGNDGEYTISGRDPQDKYLPYVQTLKSKNSTFARSGSNDVSMAYFRKEAQTQGVTSVKVWDCSLACYSQRFIDTAGAAGEGQYLETFFVPFEEASKSPPVKAYLSSVGKANADGFGAQAWIAALFFQDVVNKIVKAQGVNGLTRANFLATAKAEHNFTAQGMIGPTDIGGKVPGGCFDLLQLKGGKWVRVYPKKATTFDCNKRNIQPVQFDSSSIG
ncbi:MAG TPA: ABC transporter substrate-binding protein [Acidimicrobiia bacterium]|nr:ABC transporter substrate-binding protein [Acidimicrobiia bacterium]